METLVSKFKPSEKGLHQILGELESDIMEIIWQKKECSVRDVLLELKKEREIAYTTVMTVMSRLYRKGFIKRSKEGQAFIYHPSVTKKQLKNAVIKNVLHSIISDSSNLAMAHFVDELASDPESLRQLEKLIKERLG